MSAKEILFNPAQLKSVIMAPKHEFQVWGRGTGKSNIIGWKVQRNIKHMPRSSSVITGKTYAQLLQRTLPPTISFLERLGYIRGKSYFLGEKPPLSWKLPYEAPIKDFSRYLTFGTPRGAVGFHLASQDREGMSRGLNTDFEITDESLTIIKDRYDKEIHATNRGNLDKFGNISFHHGSHHSTSMPYTAEGKWILDAAKYYEEEAGIRLFDVWNRIVRMQIELLSIDKPNDFKAQWNEIARIRKQITPFISKDGVLFTLANAFDNINNVGLSYIKEQYRTLPPLTFMIEIMNMVIDKVEDAYYQFDTEKHFYYDSYDYSYLDSLNYNFSKLGSPSSKFDGDCDPFAPIYVVSDLGANISFLLSCQYNNRVEKDYETFNFLNEFYVKPETGKVMIDELVDNFCNYYREQYNKTVFFFKDKYGDEGRANSSKTYNSQMIDRFIKNDWNISIIDYPGKEPPHHEKYLLWSNILKENSKNLPKIRINGNNCKSFIIALSNTRVIEKDGKFSKDKSSEHKRSSVAPEEATHSTDAADKIVWIYINYFKKRSSNHIPARI